MTKNFEIVYRNPVELIPYEMNAKKHDEQQIRDLAAAIKKRGFDQPITVDKHDVIITGHGRREAALLAGLERVPVIVRDDLSEEEVKAKRLEDNRLASIDYDAIKLQQELESLVLGDVEVFGFEERELNVLVGSMTEEMETGSPFVPSAEIEAAKNDMDPKSFAQEYLASFENMSGRVYYPFDRNVHVKPLQFNPKLPIWVGQDFNIDPMSSVILQPQPNGELWAVDEVVLFSSNTAEVCDELERRFWRWKSQVTIFPDPAGAYRQHARGESDVDIFKEKGFLRVDYPKKHPPIADRVNAVNRMLMSASGETRLYIDPKCKHLIDSLEKVIYKPGSRDMDKTGGIEHSADALGYPVHRRYPVKNRVILGGSR